jgi:hypothetical protein
MFLICKDAGSFILPLTTSLVWLREGSTPPWMIPISHLLLWFNILLFLRPYEYFGIYIAIIFGVASRVFSYLVVLIIVVLAFAHSFFALLRPTKGFSLEEPPPDESDHT